MDVGLPDIDGIEVTRRIRALENTKASQVPIVALTGHANDVGKREEALAAGMQEVFCKPLSLSKLEQLLTKKVLYKEEAKVVKQQGAVIDWENSVQNLNGDEDCIRELLAMLHEGLFATERILEEAYKEQDEETLRKELHKIEGGLAYVSVPNLKNALMQFHEAVKETPKNVLHWKNAYTSLQNAIKEFRDVYAKCNF